MYSEGTIREKAGFRVSTMPTSPLFKPITLLMTCCTNSDWQIILGSNHPLSGGFRDYCLALTDKIIKENPQRVILASTDKFYFLACLMAGLHAGKEVVIPHSTASGTVRDLLNPQDLVLDEWGDFSVDSLVLTLTTFPLLKDGTISLYTSGSTGSPKVIKKSLAQINTEIEAIDMLWGTSTGQPLFLSTVPHHHIYGLLFSLLWPVCAGYRLEKQMHHFWEDLLAHCSKGDYLISSPAHLSRFPVLEYTHSIFERVFCSGAPLSLYDAQQTELNLGVIPTEILGSTETGGIAYRTQTSPNIPWTLFPGIEIKEGT